MGSASVLTGLTNKALFDYWYGQVELRNEGLIGASEHVPTFKLRHECTNYDQLLVNPAVLALDQFERSRVVTIIKYECTAKVLQRRSGELKDRAKRLDEVCRQQEEHRSQLKNLIRILQQKLFGKDQKIKQLEARIAALQAQNLSLETNQEQTEAMQRLEQELADLQVNFDRLHLRKQELTRKTQSLGGRLSHSNRYRRERDELKIENALLRQELGSSNPGPGSSQALRAQADG
jgi:DNA repair exonuclease SbcCD ATPase subunit